jgi:lactoylglutathione lyase
MKSKIALLTILTDYVPDMVNFYIRVLGFKEKLNMDKYVELENEGVRFAICDREIMLKATQNREYLKTPNGQAFELAFPCDTPDDVDRSYEFIVANGAKPIQPPASMEWGQRTAFFADPDGNIHELFSEIDT